MPIACRSQTSLQIPNQPLFPSPDSLSRPAASASECQFKDRKKLVRTTNAANWYDSTAMLICPEIRAIIRGNGDKSCACPTQDGYKLQVGGGYLFKVRSMVAEIRDIQGLTHNS